MKFSHVHKYNVVACHNEPINRKQAERKETMWKSILFKVLYVGKDGKLIEDFKYF